MRGPRQQITGLSKDATLDRECESGGHKHIDMLDLFFLMLKTQP